MLRMLPNCVVMLGMAVAMMVESRAARKMLRVRPMVMAMSLRPAGYVSAVRGGVASTAGLVAKGSEGAMSRRSWSSTAGSVLVLFASRADMSDACFLLL